MRRISLAYGAAAVVFRAFPGSFAGGHIGTGLHALSWTAAVAICEIIGGRGNALPDCHCDKADRPQHRAG